MLSIRADRVSSFTIDSASSVIATDVAIFMGGGGGGGGGMFAEGKGGGGGAFPGGGGGTDGPAAQIYKKIKCTIKKFQIIL